MLAALLTGVFPMPPSALEFTAHDGEVTGNFDTTLSFGASWRAKDPDKSLVSITNGGTSRDPNSDDGNLNYGKGDPISVAFKVTHEFDVAWRQFGFFGRASYFYDWAADRKDELGPAARDRLVSEVTLLDAYVRAGFDIGGRALDLRAGNQVVSWGESTFILNGINVINPVDVSKLRVAGAELREGLTPSPMLWASQQLTDHLTAEGVYLFKFNETEIDPAGSFFSTNDFVSDDGHAAYTGFGRREDLHGPAPDNPVNTFPADPTAQLIAPRRGDHAAKDSGQYGLALRWFAPRLNNTEFGLYHLNYHSRIPYVSGVRGGITAAATIIPGCTVLDIPTFGALLPGSGAVVATNSACAAAAGRAGYYFVEYPENIRLYGLSFNTQLPTGTALQGEYSYRPNQPLQLPSAELLGAALGIGNQITATDPVAAAGVPYGTTITGYRRVQMQQLQMTATHAFGPLGRASQSILLGEIGYTHLNLPDMKFSGPGVHLPQPGSSTASSFGSVSEKGFVTENSWGYRLLGRLDFDNAIGAATLSPRLAFSHDVSGVSPTFNEATKAMTLGLTLSYQQSLQMDLAYTAYWGGRTYSGTDPVTSPLAGFPTTQDADYASSSNPLKDRDFYAFSVSYSF
jgi:hypothetical protein